MRLVDREADVLTKRSVGSVCSIALFPVCRCEELVFRSIYPTSDSALKLQHIQNLCGGEPCFKLAAKDEGARKESFCFGDRE